VKQGQATHLDRMCQREIPDRVRIGKHAAPAGHWGTRTGGWIGLTLPASITNEGLYLAEVERNMTSKALLRLRLAQIDGEEE